MFHGVYGIFNSYIYTGFSYAAVPCLGQTIPCDAGTDAEVSYCGINPTQTDCRNDRTLVKAWAQVNILNLQTNVEGFGYKLPEFVASPCGPNPPILAYFSFPRTLEAHSAIRTTSGGETVPC